MPWILRWYRSIQSRILPWNGLGNSRSILWSRLCRPQKAGRRDKYLLLFFLFLSGARTHQAVQFPAQTLTILLGQIHKAKGLQAALGSPHGKHHSRFAPDCCTAEVEQNRHADRFVQWVFER